MGFTPRQIDQLSVWEFICCCEGKSGKANSKSAAAEALEDEDLADMGIVGFDAT